MYYVVRISRKYVSHQGNEQSCREYVNNANYLFGFDRSDFKITKGAKERDTFIKSLG